jgi:hypothetical protein
VHAAEATEWVRSRVAFDTRRSSRSDAVARPPELRQAFS